MGRYCDGRHVQEMREHYAVVPRGDIQIHLLQFADEIVQAAYRTYGNPVRNIDCGVNPYGSMEICNRFRVKPDVAAENPQTMTVRDERASEFGQTLNQVLIALVVWTP